MKREAYLWPWTIYCKDRPKRDPFWPNRASAFADGAPAGADANARDPGQGQWAPAAAPHPPTGAVGIAGRSRTSFRLFLLLFDPQSPYTLLGCNHQLMVPFEWL